jgi:hypothetical protein
MRRLTRMLMAAVLMGFLGGVVLPVLAQEGTGYKLRRVFKVNDIRRYKIVMDMNGELQMGENSIPVNMQMVMVYREKVAGIKDGKATVHTTIESMKMYVNGQEFASLPSSDPSSMVITTIVDDRNRVHEIRGLEKLAIGNPGLGMGNMNIGTSFASPALFPEEEIRVGQTWETEFPLPRAKDLRLSATQTFVGVEKVGGVDAARIKTELEVPYENLVAAAASVMQQQPPAMPPMTGTMKMVGFTWFDLATGNVLKMDGDLFMSLQMAGAANPQMPQNMQVNVTAKISLTPVKESSAK